MIIEIKQSHLYEYISRIHIKSISFNIFLNKLRVIPTFYDIIISNNLLLFIWFTLCSIVLLYMEKY